MKARPGFVAGAGALVLLVSAGPARAQEACGSAGRSHVAILAGYTELELAGGQNASGYEVGLRGGASPRGVAVGAEATYTILEGGPARPIAVRLRVGYPVVELAGITFCASALGGASTVTSGDDSAFTLAGGLALTASRVVRAGSWTLTPYLGARGLGARTGGEILAQEIAATGGSIGIETGVGARARRLTAALGFSADGFDAGLGATPYPEMALRLALGWAL